MAPTADGSNFSCWRPPSQNQLPVNSALQSLGTPLLGITGPHRTNLLFPVTVTVHSLSPGPTHLLLGRIILLLSTHLLRTKGMMMQRKVISVIILNRQFTRQALFYTRSQQTVARWPNSAHGLFLYGLWTKDGFCIF